MRIDPQLALIVVLTMGIGSTMIFGGLKKNVLELRRRRRICPSCGRTIVGRACDAH